MQPKDLISVSGFDRLAAEAPDNDWREIRIYVRKRPNGKAEIRFASEVRVVRLEGNEMQ